jgi:hypothetical protein
LQRIEDAPTSPVNGLLPADRRREHRRCAARLRRGQLEPRYRNLHTAEQLADIYEQTARRDEILEQAGPDFLRISREIRRVAEHEGPAAVRTFNAMFLEAADAAMFDGPDSEAAQRYRRMRFLISVGTRHEFEKRRQKGSPYAPVIPFLTKDPRIELRYELAAAELLPSPPSTGEAVIAIPPEDRDSGRGRIFLRIGLGEASWIGSFERGHKNVSTVLMMPDGKHLFVSAGGAGYVIDAKSRTLVEQTGTEIIGVTRDDNPMTVFVVNHNDMSLEAFGRTGRLWKTDTFGSGGFRRIAITTDKLLGETRHPSRPGWAGFSVNLATGEVRFADAL